MEKEHLEEDPIIYSGGMPNITEKTITASQSLTFIN